MTAHRVLGVGLAAAGATLAVAPVAGVAVAAVCTALLRGHDATRARRQREQEREHTVELLVAFALELRAGRGPEAALVAAAADLPSARPRRARPTRAAVPHRATLRCRGSTAPCAPPEPVGTWPPP